MNRNTRMTKKDKLNWLADIADGLRPLDARAGKFVQRLLNDPDAQVRAEAVACLWHTSDPIWIDELMDKAKDDPNLDVRTRALSALGHYLFEHDSDGLDDDWMDEEEPLAEADIQRVINFLFNTAQDERASVDERRYALESLAFLDDPEVEALIEWAFRQTDPRFRVSALFAMGRSGDLRWAEEVLTELHSANREVQYEAVRAAGELGLHEATDDLIRLVRGRGVDKPLRLQAIYALGEAGDDRAYPILEELCHARDRDVRDAAREAAEEWLLGSMTDQLDPETDGEWVDDEPGNDDEFGMNIWDNVLGTFSLN
jgi:HEAT repeat protein